MATDLGESAGRAGAHCWVERRLFEVLGGWVVGTAEADAKLLFDCLSQHHAWRADQWWDRLPVLADVERNALCHPRDDGSGLGVEVLAALEQQDGTVRRLAGAYRVVLPRLWSGYEHHRRAADAVADGATLRTLGIVGPDTAADWHQGELVLQGLLSGGEAVAVAAAAVSELERVAVGKLAAGPRWRSGRPG
jgi:hypothetical protein